MRNIKIVILIFGILLISILAGVRGEENITTDVIGEEPGKLSKYEHPFFSVLGVGERVYKDNPTFGVIVFFFFGVAVIFLSWKYDLIKNLEKWKNQNKKKRIREYSREEGW